MSGMRHRISERARRTQRVIHRLRVYVVGDGMAGHQSVIFALAATKGVLSRPHLYPHQRVCRVNDIGPDVNAVDFLNLQKAGIAGVICALEADRVLPEATGRRDFVGAVENLTGRLVRRRLPVRERLLRSRDWL